MHRPVARGRRAPLLIALVAFATLAAEPVTPASRPPAIAPDPGMLARSVLQVASPTSTRAARSSVVFLGDAQLDRQDRLEQRRTALRERVSSVVPNVAPLAGVNRFWMPELGIDRAVYEFACSRTRKPDNLVYRWGCAGRNNAYLLGHAWGVMKPLHDAYVAGRLHVGMLAAYADDAGRIRVYAVTEWRLVRPEDSRWAISDQPVPSMTLQTCVGRRSELRLNVRLVEVTT